MPFNIWEHLKWPAVWSCRPYLTDKQGAGCRPALFSDLSVLLEDVPFNEQQHTCCTCVMRQCLILYTLSNSTWTSRQWIGRGGQSTGPHDPLTLTLWIFFSLWWIKDYGVFRVDRWPRGNASGFGGLEVPCWPLVPNFAGSNPAEAVGIFRAKKILSTPSFGREEKPFAPYRRFTACERSLNVTWKSGIFRQNSSPISPLTTGVSGGDTWRCK